MPGENHKEFIKKAKKNFRKILYVECPVFNGEKVYFTDKGFTHLLRKGRELRPIGIQIKRIKLLKFAVPILSNSIVVVCQINKELKHFLSIMDH